MEVEGMVDNELIKALRCLAEGVENQGGYSERCAKKNLRNKKKYKYCWRIMQCSDCPHFQTKYRIGGNVNGIEKNVWLSKAADILEKQLGSG